MNKKNTIIIILITLVLIFAVQNAQVVAIQLLFWHVNIPRSLLIFVMLFIGFAIGRFSKSFKKSKIE